MFVLNQLVGNGSTIVTYWGLWRTCYYFPNAANGTEGCESVFDDKADPDNVPTRNDNGMDYWYINEKYGKTIPLKLPFSDLALWGPFVWHSMATGGETISPDGIEEFCLGYGQNIHQ